MRSLRLVKVPKRLWKRNLRQSAGKLRNTSTVFKNHRVCKHRALQQCRHRRQRCQVNLDYTVTPPGAITTPNIPDKNETFAVQYGNHTSLSLRPKGEAPSE